MDENRIIPYVEPIFRFCRKRLNNPLDAEDLAGEILCYALEGLRKYEIKSLDAWIWRVAHNRYARFLDARRRDTMLLESVGCEAAVLDFVDEAAAEEEYEEAFRCLHTLSREYRDLFVGHYLGGMSVRELAVKHSLPETTVKWRLNVGRQRLRKWIGESSMDKIYERILWNTGTCNGSNNPDKYLHTQLARAICQAAYEKPLTVEQISLATGIPAMYIEDELPRLEYGDAICRVGNKYATNFIVFRLRDRADTEGISEPLVKMVADRLETLLRQIEKPVSKMGFYGHDFGMPRLGYVLIPYMLRRKIRYLKEQRLHLEDGPFPLRKDGGHGWFLVEELVNEHETMAAYSTGCNVAGWNGKDPAPGYIYHYWVAKYFIWSIYEGRGMCWLCEQKIPQNSKDGVVEDGVLREEDAAELIRNKLIFRTENGYRLNFARLTEEQFAELAALLDIEDDALDDALTGWIQSVRNCFARFVPARLQDQINQWVSFYLFQLVGHVLEELIKRGVLTGPIPEEPLTDGVFYVDGKYFEP